MFLGTKNLGSGCLVVLAGLLVSVSGMAQMQLGGPVSFFYSPKDDAHRPIIDAIDKAQKTVKMTMYHLSDDNVAAALIAAVGRGVAVQAIFDKGEWKAPHDVQLVTNLTTGGVVVKQASSAFSITHEKAMIIDDQLAMISTMNQVRSFMTMLDFGIFSSDPGVVAEMNTVFAADWANADNNGNVTPDLTNANLLWSPINSSAKIIAHINTATTTITLFVENLSFPDVLTALGAAAARGVAVRVLVPKCDIGNPTFNYPAIVSLRQAGVDARMLPGPATPDMPYIHAKSIVVDQSSALLGSENYSYNSLTMARELGVIVPDAQIAADINSLFDGLWPKAELPPADAAYTCSTFSDPPTPPADPITPVNPTPGVGTSGFALPSFLQIRGTVHTN